MKFNKIKKYFIQTKPGKEQMEPNEKKLGLIFTK